MERRRHGGKAMGALLAYFVLVSSVAWGQQSVATGPTLKLTPALWAQDEAAATTAEPVEVPADPEEFGEPEMQENFVKFLSGLTASGHINVAYAYNFNDSQRTSNNTPDDGTGTPPATARNPSGAETPIRVFDYFHNEFTVHQAMLFLERPVNDDNLVGFQFTPMLGKDAQVTHGSNISFGDSDDIDVLDLNIMIYVPEEIPVFEKTTIQVGKFQTTAGAEVVAAPENTMISRSLQSSFMIPFTHAGVRATKTVLKKEDETSLLDLSIGIANGWDDHNDGNFGGSASFPTWLTYASLSPLDSLSFAVSYFVGETDGAGEYRNLVDIVADWTLIETDELATNVLLNFDYRSDEVGNATTGGYGDAFAFSGILRQDFSLTSEQRNWYAAFRGAYYGDEDGVTLLGPPGSSPGLSTGPIPGLTELRIWRLAWTVGYRPFESLLLRAEVDYDNADHNVYRSGRDSNQTTITADVTYIF